MAEPTPATLQHLAELRLLEGTSEDVRRWLAGQCGVERHPAGRVLLSPGAHNATLYCILTGRVRLKLQPGDREILASLGPGDCFGEMSIIEGTAPSAFAIAHSECTLATLSGEVLWALIDRSHTVARNLLLVLSSRLRGDHRLIRTGRERQRAFAAHAQVDPLTGLYNRRWLDPMLGRMVARHRRSGVPLALLMLDADHFKAYNDRFGHLAGDRALTALAGIVQANLRPGDAAARFGGEEFVVLLPGSNRQGARGAAERLRAAVAGTSLGGGLAALTVSIGVAALGPRGGPRALLAAADKALYRAKRAGRNRVEE